MRAGGAQVVVTTDRFDDDVAALTESFGFRVEEIFPADDPSTIVVSCEGTMLRLERGVPGRPVELRLRVERPRGPLRLPGGTRVSFAVDDPEPVVPPGRPGLAIRHQDDEATPGRAGMRYHDLVPDRWGGRFIGSIISIPEGGPVPDYVHFHEVRFQMIAVKRGWVRVVYEGQGEPFVMHAGDCVTQPPGIRHQVLESSPGLEVVEVTCPAEHVTIADWDHPLPDAPLPADHTWAGQRFVRHVAADAVWAPGQIDGWESCDTGIAAGTDGLADVRLARAGSGASGDDVLTFRSEFALIVVLEGSLRFLVDGRPAVLLTGGSSVAVPAGLAHRFREPSPDCLVLVVAISG